MAALALLSRLCLADVELRIRGGNLAYKAPTGVLDATGLGEIKAHKAALLTLLDGSTCRWCRRPISWRDSDGAVALADGTSLHATCREPFHVDRIMRHATTAVAPTLAADPGEVVVRGDLARVEMECHR